MASEAAHLKTVRSVCATMDTQTSTLLASSTLQVLSEKEILPSNRPNPAPFSFGSQECPVYMTLLHQYGAYEKVTESGTQATGFINKCLQIRVQRQNPMKNFEHLNDVQGIPVEYRTIELYTEQKKNPLTQFNSSRVYSANSKSRIDEQIKEESTCKETADRIVPSAPLRRNRQEVTVANVCCPKRAKGFFSSLFKVAETQADDCSPCCKRKTTFAAATNDSEDLCPNILGTISHIRIGPPPPCPAHGTSCTGPCKAKGVKITPNEERARMKISTKSNSRRGVFELAIRKLTGAPFARNELLLEWTPPPSCAPPCPLPCSEPGCPSCSSPSCSSVKYKMVICKLNPCNSPRKPPCSQPGHPPPCQLGCRAPCHSKPCLMCKPCVRSCSPPPCKPPSKKPCPSKCTRPCSVGRGKLRKKSTTRIRSHPRHKSPCLNRKPECPVVRARSQPGGALCCGAPCAPRLCRSTARCSSCQHPC